MASGAVMLVLGCCIYLLFRSKSLKIHQWCSTMELSQKIDAYRYYVQSWSVPDIVRYSFPDGLYNTAYILIMNSIWDKQKSPLKYFIILFVPVLSIISEVLQNLGIIEGTFDYYDLICYFVPVFIFVCYKIIFK